MASVQLSDKLYEELKSIAANSKEFSNVNDYVSYILEQVVIKKKQSSGASNAVAATPDSSQRYSKEDEDKIRERLKNLGYLD